jgi:hypothetical protein
MAPSLPAAATASAIKVPILRPHWLIRLQHVESLLHWKRAAPFQIIFSVKSVDRHINASLNPSKKRRQQYVFEQCQGSHEPNSAGRGAVATSLLCL